MLRSLFLLLLFGLPIFLVLFFGSLLIGFLGFVLTIGLAAITFAIFVVLPKSAGRRQRRLKPN